MRKDIATQVQETQRVPYKINPKRIIPKHILTKLIKSNTKKIYKGATEKQQVIYKGIPIRLTIFQQKLYRPEGVAVYT